MVAFRVISMTFGRPAMISKASCGPVPLPATVDEEYIPASSGGEVSQPEHQPSMMAFYAKSLELYEILNDILLSLYKPVPEESPEDIHDFYFNKEGNEGERTIFDLDRSLTRWTRSLPSHLRGTTDNEVFLSQGIVLRARWVCVCGFVVYKKLTSETGFYMSGCFSSGRRFPSTALLETPSFPIP